MSTVLAGLAAAMRTDDALAAASPYQIRYHGDPILSTPCERIASLEELPPGLVPAMKRIMGEWRHGYPPGVGISAPQVGAALCVILAPIDGATAVMINPRILEKSFAAGFGLEGCLSTPGFFTSVRRSLWVDVEWEDDAWTTHFRRIGFEGGALPMDCKEGRQQFEARVIQHEVDHLFGRQIVDGLPRQQRRRAERCVAGLR
jgi:peptide deformylase